MEDLETLVIAGDAGNGYHRLRRVAGRLKTKGAGIRYSHRGLKQVIEVRGATVKDLLDVLARELNLELLKEGEENGCKSGRGRIAA